MPGRSCRSGFPLSSYSPIGPSLAALDLPRHRPQVKPDRITPIGLAMRLTSLADYAVVMLTAAARHQGEGWLSASAMAEETGVPLATAQRLSGRLAAAGLLRSTQIGRA